MQIMALPQVDGYDIIEKVGVGSFSVVYKAQKKTGDKDFVAVKCMDRRYQKQSFVDRVVTEISVLKMLKNDYIVDLIDFVWDPKYIFIITEYCDEGDLSHYIRRRHKLNEALVRMFMQQLALALKYLNRYNICHMDLKPQNLLVCSKPKLKLKVADFGLSQILSPENVEQYRYAGSLLYMAPEKILNKQYDARVDLWSVGVIMYECLFGRTPFLNPSAKCMLDFMTKGISIEPPKFAVISPPCANLLLHLLKYNPDERIGFEDFFKHEFLDLIHIPTQENYLTAIDLIHNAIELDKKNQYSESLPKYREAIKYLEAFIPAETDATKKALLETRLNDYKKWADTLEEVLKGTISAPQLSQQTLPLTEVHFKTLQELAANTPKLATALDIGASAEMYLAENRLSIALEKFRAALNILIPLLEGEPIGPRRDLLHLQIQKWLGMAENIKLD